MEQLRNGYKRTEAGVIPDDWIIVPLSKAVKTFQLGGNYPNGDIVNEYPLMKMGNIDRGVFKLDKIQYIKNVTPLVNDELKYGDVLFNTRNTLELVGKVAIWRNELPRAYFNSNLMRFEFDKTIISSSFFFNYLINTPLNISQLKAIATGTTSVAAIYTRDLVKVNLLIPTLTEQKAIADALSDVDALIANLEKLIAKKKAIKQGAMQQLLTPPHKGGKRLEGFSGVWKEVKLGDVCNIRKGQLITESSRVNGEIPVIAGGRTPAYFHNKPNRIGKTITISASGASAGYVSFHNRPIFASDCSTIEEGANYSIEFIYYFLQLIQERIYKMQTGGAQPHIHPSDLYPILIDLPLLIEQQTIAQTIRDMELEIQFIDYRLEKAKMLKQGMMQELLTGKTRLV